MEEDRCPECDEVIYMDANGVAWSRLDAVEHECDEEFEFECPICSTTVDSDGELCEDCENAEDDDGS